MHSYAVHVTIFSNGSIIPTGIKFTELHALTQAACSYALLLRYNRLHLWYGDLTVWGVI